MSSLTKTLSELEAHTWESPDFSSALMENVHRLRGIPIGEFTIEDLRVTIGQSVGLKHLVPLAIIQLQSDPMAEGDFFPGDLLCSVLRVDHSFWQTHPDLREPMIEIVNQAATMTDEVRVNEECKRFRTRAGN